MNVTRYWDPDAIRPLHVVMIVLACAMLAGGFLLLSVPESVELVDGAKPWGPNSLLRSTVQLLCLNYEYPARHSDAVKGFCLMFFSGAALLVVGIVLASRPIAGEEVLESDIAVDRHAAAQASPEDEAAPKRAQIAPLIAAQMMAGIYLVWMLLRSLSVSSTVSAPQAAADNSSIGTALALGATAIAAGSFLWSFSLGATLTRAAARLVTRGIVLISVLSAVIAVWYFYGRNPNIRAKFPFTNPTFMGACLLPGIVLSLTAVFRGVREVIVHRRARAAGQAVLAAAAAAMLIWPFVLAESRGAMVGLVYGILAIAFLLLPSRLKWTPVVLGGVLAVLGALYARNVISGSSQTGRDATARVRFHAWGYAVDLFQRHPVAGCGPGGFSFGVDDLIGKEWTDDPLKRTDVEEDPRALSDRLGHAHNEWLEVLAELGSVGFVLLAAVLALTFMAGLNALEQPMPSGQRFALVALLGALAAMVVEQCFGVGLRLGETPCAFYTVLGLVWAMCGSRTNSLLGVLSQRNPVRLGSSAGAFALGLMVIVLAFLDFAAARAAYDAAHLIRQNKLEEGLARYESAERQLRPDRAMIDMMLYCEASVARAQMLQDKAFLLSYEAQNKDESSRATLLAEAQKVFDDSRRHAKMANELLRAIHLTAPGFLGASRLSADLWTMNWQFAYRLGKQDEAASCLASAANDLKLELARQPFDVDLAARYIQTAGPNLDFESAILVLARPLRHSAVTNDYINAVTAFADATPGFDDAFSTVYDRAFALAGRTPFEPQSAIERWSPEVVRLGGILQLTVSDYAGAVKSFSAAAEAYERLDLFRAAPLGSAYALAELADAQFLMTPEMPDAALATLERAFGVAPQGEEGRFFQQRNSVVRKAAYLLAGGREAEARTILAELRGIQDAETMGREVAAAYADMTFRVMKRLAWQIPDRVWDWVARALELDPRNIRANFLAANLSILDGDCARAEASLLAALQAGAPPEEVLGAIRLVYRALPDCKPMEDLWKQIAADQPLPTLPEYGPQPQPEGEPKPEGEAKPEGESDLEEISSPETLPDPDAGHAVEPVPQGSEDAPESPPAPESNPG